MDPDTLIRSFGYIGLFLIVFAESGLLIGFFLPGDSLLFTAGFLASQGILNIYGVLAVFLVAAILGVQAGYLLGRHYGPKLFTKTDSLIFNQNHIEKSRKFFDRHGGKTILIARFTPVVRCIAPLLAGAGDMKFRSFVVFNILGAVIWVFAITLMGYFAGKHIPNVEHYILPTMIILAIAVILPSLGHLGNAYWKRRRKLRLNG